MIETLGDIIQTELVKKVNKTEYFSVSDDTADISRVYY